MTGAGAMESSKAVFTMKEQEVRQLAAEAKQAFLRGHKHRSRRLAWAAVKRAPENALGWIVLASVSSPEASQFYLQRAEVIDPGNPTVERGLAWAEKRLADREPVDEPGDQLLNPQVQTARSSAAPDILDSVPLTRMRWQTLLRQASGNLPLMAGLVILVTVLLITIFGPLFTTYDPNITTISALPHFDSETMSMIRPPFPASGEHWLGTDRWGNDLLSMIIHGARVTLTIAAYITLARVCLGTLLGSLAGWRKGSLFDQAVMTGVAVLGSVPAIIGSLILILALGMESGPLVFMVALTAVGWTESAEYVRSELMVIKGKHYIEGARAVGLNELQVVVRHVLPNLVPQLFVFFFLDMGSVLVLLAELSFLDVFLGGFSVFSMGPFERKFPLPNAPEWGSLISRTSPYMRSHTYMILGPGLAFFITIVGMNSLGVGLGQLFDKAGVNTAFLMKKKMLLVAAVFVGTAVLLLRLTGPQRSYHRAAQTFEGAHAVEMGQELEAARRGPPDGEGGPSLLEVMVASHFKAAGLKEAALTGPENLNATYFNEDPAGRINGIWGLYQGYDNKVGHELIILTAPYPEPGQAGDLSGLAVMLEILRAWSEEQVGPRRSVLFLAWEDTPEKLQRVVEDPEAVRHLVAMTPTTSFQQTAVFQLGPVGRGESTLMYDRASEETLVRQLRKTAGLTGKLASGSPPSGYGAVSREVHSLTLWQDKEPGGGGWRTWDPDLLRRVGEVLSETLIRMVREENY